MVIKRNLIGLIALITSYSLAASAEAGASTGLVRWTQSSQDRTPHFGTIAVAPSKASSANHVGSDTETRTGAPFPGVVTRASAPMATPQKPAFLDADPDLYNRVPTSKYNQTIKAPSSSAQAREGEGLRRRTPPGIEDTRDRFHQDVRGFDLEAELGAGTLPPSLSEAASEAPMRTIDRFNNLPIFATHGTARAELQPVTCFYETNTVFGCWNVAAPSRINAEFINQRNGLDRRRDGRMGYAPRTFGIYSTVEPITEEKKTAMNNVSVAMMEPGSAINEALLHSTGGGQYLEKQKENLTEASLKAFQKALQETSISEGAAIHFVGPYISITQTKSCPIIAFIFEKDSSSEEPACKIRIMINDTRYPLQNSIYNNLPGRRSFFVASPSFWEAAMNKYSHHIPQNEKLKQIALIIRDILVTPQDSGEEDLFKNILARIYTKIFGFNKLRQSIKMGFIQVEPMSTPPTPAVSAPRFEPQKLSDKKPWCSCCLW